MEFKEALQTLVDRCEGAQAAVLMDLDGVAIESVIGDSSVDIDTLGVGYAQMLNETKKMSQGLEFGAMNELVITTERNIAVLRMLGEQYFLGLVMATDSNTGKGRYLARMAEFGLLPELS